MCSVRLLDYNCFIERKIERKKAECMHVRAGTNKDGVCLDRNTTPPPSSWTAHAEKQTNIEIIVKRRLKGQKMNRIIIKVGAQKRT